MFDVFSDKEGCRICGRRGAAQVVLEIALGNLFRESLFAHLKMSLLRSVNQ